MSNPRVNTNINKSRSFPTISNHAQLLQYLQRWRSALRSSVKQPNPPSAPLNVTATAKYGGILVSWAAPITGVDIDGYELLRSTTADFSQNVVIIPLRHFTQTQYLDAIGTIATTIYYKVQATAGTASEPYSIKGDFSLIVSVKSFDASPTIGSIAPTTDTYASNTGGSTSISVASSVNKSTNPDIAANSGTVDPGSFNKFYISAPAPNYVGGAVPYTANTSEVGLVASDELLFLGKITTQNGTPTNSGHTGGNGRGELL